MNLHQDYPLGEGGDGGWFWLPCDYGRSPELLPLICILNSLLISFFSAF